MRTLFIFCYYYYYDVVLFFFFLSLLYLYVCVYRVYIYIYIYNIHVYVYECICMFVDHISLCVCGHTKEHASVLGLADLMCSIYRLISCEATLNSAVQCPNRRE